MITIMIIMITRTTIMETILIIIVIIIVYCSVREPCIFFRTIFFIRIFPPIFSEKFEGHTRYRKMLFFATKNNILL